MPGLNLEGVSKSFPTRGEPLVVLRNISLALQSGENLAILGPSGSGKSTLLHLMGTLDTPTTGTITLGDENPFTLDEPQLAHFRNRRIGFVFQEHHLLPQLSALENVLVPCLAEGTPNEEMVSRARSLLDRVGLSERLSHRPGMLSGGEQQRVAVARALVMRPALLLADEPTGDLDETTGESLHSLLRGMHAAYGLTSLIATHNPRLAAACDRALCLEDGKLREA